MAQRLQISAAVGAFVVGLALSGTAQERASGLIEPLRDLFAALFFLFFAFQIPTDDLPKIKLGQQVKFTVSGSAGEYTGVIAEIASQGEYTPKTIQTKKERANIVYAVKIKVNNENNILKPGMPAEVVLD